MNKSALPEMPYERVAMAGGEMPDGLRFSDQILFLSLRVLYENYKRGLVDRETAKREKTKLLRNYNAQKNIDDISAKMVDQIRQTELARAEYRKNKTIENADKLVRCLEGGVVF